MELQSKASFRPWHADYYVVRTPLSLDELREHIHASKTYADQLEWQLDTTRGLRSLRFFVSRVAYSGDIPVKLIAKCVAKEEGGNSVITVTIRVTELIPYLILLATIGGLVGAYIFDGLRWPWIILFTLVFGGFNCLAIWQVRRRDPPQILASRIAESLHGSVESTSKPPREPFRL